MNPLMRNLCPKQFTDIRGTQSALDKPAFIKDHQELTFSISNGFCYPNVFFFLQVLDAGGDGFGVGMVWWPTHSNKENFKRVHLSASYPFYLNSIELTSFALVLHEQHSQRILKLPIIMKYSCVSLVRFVYFFLLQRSLAFVLVFLCCYM